MSDIQIGLLMLGGIVIALVFAFNTYQEWRFRKRTRQAFSRHHADVLLDVPKNHVRDGKQERLEPVLLQSAWFRPNNKAEDIENLFLVGAGTLMFQGLSGYRSANAILRDHTVVTVPVALTAPGKAGAKRLPQARPPAAGRAG